MKRGPGRTRNLKERKIPHFLLYHIYKLFIHLPAMKYTAKFCDFILAFYAKEKEYKHRNINICKIQIF